jgi:hypothetical protein
MPPSWRHTRSSGRSRTPSVANHPPILGCHPWRGPSWARRCGASASTRRPSWPLPPPALRAFVSRWCLVRRVTRRSCLLRVSFARSRRRPTPHFRRRQSEASLLKWSHLAIFRFGAFAAARLRSSFAGAAKKKAGGDSGRRKTRLSRSKGLPIRGESNWFSVQYPRNCVVRQSLRRPLWLSQTQGQHHPYQ